MATLREWLADTMVDVLGCDRAKITDDARFVEDLGGDSLDGLEIVMLGEDHYAVQITDEEWSKVNTFGEAVALFAAKVEPA